MEGKVPLPFDTRGIDTARLMRIVRLIMFDGDLDEPTEENVDETGLEERDITLVMSQA